MAAKIFVDGAAGTTGLEIRERLDPRKDLSFIRLSDAERKDTRARSAALNEADIVILCLPDEAAREAVGLIENPSVRVIDASTAHRVAADWVFGFPELEPSQYERIAGAKRVSNPGCYSTGFVALVRPLVRLGFIPGEWPLTAAGMSGYSGGGRPMIAEFEDRKAPAFTSAVVRNYALTLAHKHVPEMRKHAGLAHDPIFAPSVGRYYRGMIVDVPLHLWSLPGKPRGSDLRDALADAYRGRAYVDVASKAETDALSLLDPESLNNTNRMKLYVFENEAQGHARLAAVLDNLGKGASGAAVQNLNIMLGLPESTGL
jgi:N-acetyl-gamma-glutamyl-phosphate reductase